MSMLGLDVKRTDRTLVYFEKQENLSKLWDILAVYSWFDKDVGYCQGQLLIDFLVLPRFLSFFFFFDKVLHWVGLIFLKELGIMTWNPYICGISVHFS